MLSIKQGGIKYHFLSLWYDSTWDWTQVSRAIGEHSNHNANVRYTYQHYSIIKIFSAVFFFYKCVEQNVSEMMIKGQNKNHHYFLRT